MDTNNIKCNNSMPLLVFYFSKLKYNFEGASSHQYFTGYFMPKILLL